MFVAAVGIVDGVVAIGAYATTWPDAAAVTLPHAAVVDDRSVVRLLVWKYAQPESAPVLRRSDGSNIFHANASGFPTCCVAAVVSVTTTDVADSVSPVRLFAVRASPDTDPPAITRRPAASRESITAMRRR